MNCCWNSIAGAQVSATNVGTQVTVATTTDDRGDFELVIRPPEGSQQNFCSRLRVDIIASGYEPVVNTPLYETLAFPPSLNPYEPDPEPQDCPGDGRVYSYISLARAGLTPAIAH